MGVLNNLFRSKPVFNELEYSHHIASAYFAHSFITLARQLSLLNHIDDYDYDDEINDIEPNNIITSDDLVVDCRYLETIIRYVHNANYLIDPFRIEASEHFGGIDNLIIHEDKDFLLYQGTLQSNEWPPYQHNCILSDTNNTKHKASYLLYRMMEQIILGDFQRYNFTKFIRSAFCLYHSVKHLQVSLDDITSFKYCEHEIPLYFSDDGACSIFRCSYCSHDDAKVILRDIYEKEEEEE